MKLKVILVEPEYPINLGTIARVMKNFGVTDLILVNPKVSPTNKIARKFAVHAVDILENAKIHESLEEALNRIDLAIGTSGLAGDDYIPERVPISPEEFAKRLSIYDGEIGLVFGRESRGLDNEELKKLDFTVTIPTRQERERLVEFWAKFLDILEYPKDLEKRRFYVLMFKRFLGRGFIYAKEVHSLYSPLRRAIKLLERCKDDIN